jgi:hypothetical protein
MLRIALLMLAALIVAPLPAAAERLAPMSFRIVGDAAGNRWIAADGDIMENSDARYMAVLRRGGRGLPVHIHSGGGSLVGGMKLGLAFRQAGTRVVVARTAGSAARAVATAGICASACVHALAGGTDRVTANGSRIGVHESYRAAVNNGRITRRIAAANDNQDIRREVLAIQAAYFRSMGVSAEIVALGVGVPPNQIRALSDREIGATGLARTAGSPASVAGRNSRAGLERYRPDDY